MVWRNATTRHYEDVLTSVIRFTPGTVSRVDPLVIAVIGQLERLRATVPLRSVSLHTNDNTTFSFNLLAVDNRAWVQSIEFANRDDTNPRVTLSVAASWYATEVALIHNLQAALLALRNSRGLQTFAGLWSEEGTATVVTGSPGTVSPGAPITAMWTAPNANPEDWVGIMPADQDNTHYLTYVFVTSVEVGSHVFTAPSTPGQYEFRYLPNNLFVDTARSVPFTVG